MNGIISSITIGGKTFDVSEVAETDNGIKTKEFEPITTHKLISKELLDEVIDVLECHHFSSSGYSNNEDVIDVQTKLEILRDQ